MGYDSIAYDPDKPDEAVQKLMREAEKLISKAEAHQALQQQVTVAQQAAQKAVRDIQSAQRAKQTDTPLGLVQAQDNYRNNPNRQSLDDYWNSIEAVQKAEVESKKNEAATKLSQARAAYKKGKNDVTREALWNAIDEAYSAGVT